MFFSVGVETPDNDAVAWGIVVPALCNEAFGCYSAADDRASIATAAREAILLVLEEMIRSGKYRPETIADAGHLVYAAHPDYRAYDSWFAIEVDLSGLEGRQQRINITLPDTLIQRIDNRVKASAGRYRDRSHFLAQAARHELREE
ncbi:type II toxin-antitoxin system HicB family antitoxin [Cronobacter dublinensis]|uniref:DNA-binding protein, CopG family n=1 Tax=Cronobacter dublinensis 1210 TaxID=1208656 RepID=A0ABP1W2U1_9ENTR|nr:type II toxin-antitoxin system HicB family antitoxin [Cronobacter dublinensis]CCJ79370.1 DNA-binding protein, CopG family [Cronobacter dublinensis 1210]ALB68160.1 CopG family transcriptional regulator [Cronobacter dublinensis subsp. dublinensis LMG 23823]EGT4379578.1 CopG family transcriptional regulator [Cronobacter dublinensis]EKP4474951.1 type II toxin-antitoxin system HicB family antitoxin [Cronobacter dublinensis]EKY3223725.1 type II toxin-antitoxin system HicB family antitoxin [Cronob